MNGKMTNIFTIWDIEDDGKKAVVRMTSSRKIKEDETDLLNCEKINKKGYINTSWSFVNFVGKAYNKLKKHAIESGDKITDLDINFNMEPYFDKETSDVAYRKQPKISVFDFELPEAQTTNYDKAPKVAEEETETKKVEEEPENQEEYPF